MNQYKTGGYTRITKQAAFRLYREGNPIYIIPCKLKPDNIYMPAVAIRAAETPRRWENRINEFEFYNCNTETGRYTAYYIKSGAR